MFVGVQLTVVSVAGEFLRDSEHVEAQRSREPAAQNVFPFGAVAFRDRSVPPCAPSKTLALSTAFSCLVCLASLASLFSSDSQRVETASENGCFSYMSLYAKLTLGQRQPRLLSGFGFVTRRIWHRGVTNHTAIPRPNIVMIYRRDTSSPPTLPHPCVA